MGLKINIPLNIKGIKIGKKTEIAIRQSYSQDYRKNCTDWVLGGYICYIRYIYPSQLSFDAIR